MARRLQCRPNVLRFFILGLASTGITFASTVFQVANFNFANPALAPRTNTNESVPGWTGAWGDQHLFTAYGVFNPQVGVDVNSVPTGTQVAFLDASNAENSSIFQDVTANGLGNPTVAANTTYTLSVEVGARLNAPFASALIELFAGGTAVGSFDNCAPNAPGNWGLCTITWNSASNPSLVGQDLGVFFVTHQQPSSAFYQVLYNDVQLTAVGPVPEPSAMLLVLPGIVALAGTRYIRNKSAKRRTQWLDA